MDQIREMLWMFPWYFMILWVLPAGKGACSPEKPYTGWVLVGTCALLGVILNLTTWVG